MQEKYSENGLNPNLAINIDDLNDFGGPEAFRGF
jgi:hypothetical protein